MQLIQIDENKMINPEKVAYVQKRGTKGNVSIVINVGGRDHVVKTNVKQLLAELMASGVSTSNDQFFHV